MSYKTTVYTCYVRAGPLGIQNFTESPNETSTEIAFADYDIAIHIPGGVQRPTGESDAIKNEVEYVHGLLSFENLCTKRPWTLAAATRSSRY